jgi:GntR family transcriptional regulator
MALGKFIRIDPGNGMPVYRQVMHQIKQAVASGTLKSDDQLPTIKELAQAIQINPNTIAKAYHELEHEGVIYKHQGRGSFVARTEKSSVGIKERKETAAKAATRFWIEVFPLQLKADEVLEALKEGAQQLNFKFVV